MADDSGDDSTKNGQGDDSQKVDTSKVFSNGYNEGVETQEKRVLKKFSEITGKEFDSIDDVYGWGKDSSAKLAEAVSDPTQTQEYKELQSSLSKYKKEAKEAQNTTQAIKNQYKFDSIHSQASNKLKQSAEFVIDESDAKDLFQTKHEIEWKDGNPIVKKNGTPVLDENGNYKPLQSVLSDFYKPYTKPATDGTGGGSGDGGDIKPKYEDYKKAHKNDDRELKSKLIKQAKSAGAWAESDAPAVVQ